VIDPELLELLACPICEERPPLRLEGDALVCTLKGHRFPIVDGIPQLLPESSVGTQKEVNGHGG